MSNLLFADIISLCVLFVGILTIIITGATLIYIFTQNRRNELAVLRSLLQHLEYIKSTALSQREQLRGQGQNWRPPSWTLIDADLNFYLPHINYVIRTEKGAKPIYTRELKQNLIKIADSVNKINNLIGLIYQSEINGRFEQRQSYRNELLNTPYYPELSEYVDNANYYIKRIIKPFKRKQWFYF